jgi:cation diffusion facilitator family transporter
VIGGAVSIWEGIQALLHPPALEAFWVGVGVLVVALILDGTSRTIAVRSLRAQAQRREISVRTLLRESPDPAITTVYLEDTVDVIGAALALAALVLHRITGSALPDAIATLLIGCLLAYIAVRLARRNRALLTNQSVPDRYLQRLRHRLSADPDITEVTRLDAVYLGPGQVLVAAEVQMAEGLAGADVARGLDRIRGDLLRDVPAVARVYLTPVSLRAG